MDKRQEIRAEMLKVAERPNLTFEAIKQLNELWGAEQALNSLWGTDTDAELPQERHTNSRKELSDVFPALEKYQADHNEVNLQKLMVEILEFCRSVYASTRSEDERKIYHNFIEKLNK